jgi:two-component system chemotaxis response regulator CheB
MKRRNIVAIGGSAGASPVLKRILADLAPEFPASIFVVTHSQLRGAHALKEMLASTSALPIDLAIDEQPIEPGRIYLAAADRHLLLDNGVIRLGAGPRENMARPAIDPLFRSAALAYGPQTIGLVLSGDLDDGASGLAAIKARGGVALVQHPLDADVPSMPKAALSAVDVDRALRADEIAAALTELAGSPAPAVELPPDPTLELEVRIAAGARLGSARLGDVAAPTTLSCPTCHGVLSELKSGPLRFRCQSGHAFTPEAALRAQETDVDEAVLLALRVMEERVTLVARMASEARERGRIAIAEVYEKSASQYEGYADTLRRAAARLLTPEMG